MPATTLYTLYPVAIALGLAILTLSFTLPEPAAVTVLRVIAIVVFCLAAVFAIPGIA